MIGARKLAIAMLYSAAKTTKPSESYTWLHSHVCRQLCEQAGVDHKEYVDAVLYILDKSEAQRIVLLKALKKNLRAIGI